MLKKWIDEIRIKPDLYKADCWKYHISGNVVELSILPGYLKQKKSYRCSVIAVGQVLQALSIKIEQENLNFHIQSFPSLETPEIVASIRMDQQNEFTGNLGSKEENRNQKKDATSIIRNLANKYHLEGKEIEQPEKQISEEISFNKDCTAWFVVFSLFNNPFTWLNIGYLKESLQNERFNLSHPEVVCVIDFCSLNDDSLTNIQIPENRYIQSLIGIQPRNA